MIPEVMDAIDEILLWRVEVLFFRKREPLLAGRWELLLRLFGMALPLLPVVSVACPIDVSFITLPCPFGAGN